MSFDIFLQCFRNGEPACFKRTVFEEIFLRDAIDPNELPSGVTYADGGAEIYVEDKEEIDGVSFDHCGGDTFFAALLELADRTGAVVFWPTEGRQIAVTNPDVVGHLPAELAALGPAYIVKTGPELRDAIFHEIDPASSSSSA